MVQFQSLRAAIPTKSVFPGSCTWCCQVPVIFDRRRLDGDIFLSLYLPWFLPMITVLSNPWPGNLKDYPMTGIGTGNLSMYSVFFSPKLRSYDDGNFGPWVSFEVFFFFFCIFKPFNLHFPPLNHVLLALQSLMTRLCLKISYPVFCEQAFSALYLFFSFNMSCFIPKTSH